MSKNAILLLAVFLLAACKEVSFREPQPRGRRPVNTVPPKLQGRYLPYQENGQLSRDTIIISARGYRFAYYEPVPPANHRAGYEEGVLSDSLVLKSYRGYYFLNLYEDPEWLLRVIRQENNGDLTYMTMEQEGVGFSDYVRRLAKEIHIDSMKLSNKTVYHIDPSPAKLLQLIEKGFFTKTPLKKIE